jgi:hypothetical protein
VSPIALALLAAALVLIAATEWGWISGRLGIEGRQRRERKRRKSQLRVVRTETDEFARAVERDLAALPTVDERESD